MLLDGFADGTMIEVEPASDDYGGEGRDEGRRRRRPTSANPPRHGRLRFLQTSQANDRLSTLRNSSRAATASGFAAAFSVRDASGTTKVQGTAWIPEAPHHDHGEQHRRGARVDHHGPRKLLVHRRQHVRTLTRMGGPGR